MGVVQCNGDIGLDPRQHVRQPGQEGATSAPGRELPVDGLDDAHAVRADWSGGEVWGSAHDDLVAELRGADAPVVVLGGPSGPTDVGARIDLAERVRWAGKTVVVEVPVALRSEGAAAVGAGRADAVVTVG